MLLLFTVVVIIVIVFAVGTKNFSFGASPTQLFSCYNLAQTLTLTLFSLLGNEEIIIVIHFISQCL